MLSERRIHGRAEDPPEDRTVARSPLVGSGARRTSSLLSLSSPLPHPSRSSRVLFHSHQSRRETLYPGVRLPRVPATFYHRAKTPQSFSLRPAGFFHVYHSC